MWAAIQQCVLENNFLCSVEARNATEAAEIFGKAILELPKGESCENLTCLLNRSPLVGIS